MGRRGGTLFDVDFDAHARACALVASLVSDHAAGREGLLGAIHDVGSGGLAVALAEMAIAGGVGATVEDVTTVAEAFCERPGRFLVTTTDVSALLARAEEAGVDACVLGGVAGSRLMIGGLADLDVDSLTHRSHTALSATLEAVGEASGA